MYHCYLRGKQYELLAVRETIAKIVEANMTILVEPVKKMNVICWHALNVSKKIMRILF